MGQWSYHDAMEMLTGILWIAICIWFAYLGIKYTNRYFDGKWKPKDLQEKLQDPWSPAGKSRMVQRSEAAEDQPDWSEYKPRSLDE